jgi:OOP family OmpA-OmpF porin
MRHLSVLVAGCLFAAAAHGEAPVLPLPQGAVLVSEESTPGAVAAFPFGPFADGAVPLVEPQGRIVRRVWQVPDWDGTAAALLRRIREQLIAEGFAEVYACEARVCGGFDFRFALDLLPAPEMYVDLSDYLYVLTERVRDDERTMLSLVASRSAGTGYIHLTAVGLDDPEATGTAPSAGTAPVAPAPDVAAIPVQPAPAGPLADTLTLYGRAVLDGLEFAPGSSRLSDEDYQGLADLARFLEDNPGASVALVGHTDAIGGLPANIALSRARAGAVRTRLIEGFGVDPRRVTAEGAGSLAPRASNLSDEGRAANRRVEVVLLSR